MTYNRHVYSQPKGPVDKHSSHEMKRKLEKEEKGLQEKINALNTWLHNHPSHPDFMKIAGDRNLLTVKLENVRKQLDNIRTSNPTHGYTDSPVKQIITQPGNAFRQNI